MAPPVSGYDAEVHCPRYLGPEFWKGHYARNLHLLGKVRASDDTALDKETFHKSMEEVDRGVTRGVSRHHCLLTPLALVHHSLHLWPVQG